MKNGKSFLKTVFGKKGVTLAELCVVMALLGILSTTITSFCMIIQNYSNKLSIERETRESYAFFNTALNTWIDYVDSEDYVITTKDSGKTLVATNTNEDSEIVCTFSIEDERLHGTLPSGNVIDLEMETFQDVYFIHRTKPSSEKGGLIISQITYLKNARGATDKMQSVRYFRAAKVGD